MANTILTISMITKESLRVLENNLSFAKGVSRKYDDKYGVDGAKIGDTLNIRKPPRYLGRVGQTAVIEDHTQTSVPLTLTTQRGVDLQFSSKELALSLDEFSDGVIKPAVASISNGIDRDGLLLYQDVYNSVGVPGTALTSTTSLLAFLQAGAKMTNEGAPLDKMRSAVIDANTQVTMVDGLKGLFQSSEKIAEQYERGNMGLAAGLKFSIDQNVVNHTVGPLGGAPLVNGANQTGANLITDGWTAAVASRLLKGDVFTIAGVFAVNPQNLQSTGQLRQFTVLANASSDVVGNVTIPISPSLTLVGPFKTVTALAADNAAITVLGPANTVSAANLCYHRDAFVLATADLPLPSGVDMAARVSDKQLGISIRMVRQYDILTDRFVCRMDVLYGWKTLYPELACRVYGN